MPRGIVTETWAHPRSSADFACQWRTEVEAARTLGKWVGGDRYMEVRYETLVSDPEAALEAICEFAGIPFERGMLEYSGDVEAASKPHQHSLKRPPTVGLRDWRSELAPDDVAAFEDVAGETLAELGYPLSAGQGHQPSLRGRARLASYRARSWAWRTSGLAVQRSPLWRRRHPRLA